MNKDRVEEVEELGLTEERVREVDGEKRFSR